METRDAHQQVKRLERRLVEEAQGQRRADVLKRLLVKFEQMVLLRGSDWSPSEYEAYHRARAYAKLEALA